MQVYISIHVSVKAHVLSSYVSRSLILIPQDQAVTKDEHCTCLRLTNMGCVRQTESMRDFRDLRLDAKTNEKINLLISAYLSEIEHTYTFGFIPTVSMLTIMLVLNFAYCIFIKETLVLFLLDMIHNSYSKH